MAKLYLSTDPNAPVLNGLYGSLVQVLKACLVTGYGEKAGAGWTMPFANPEETIGVFRSSPVEGNSYFLRVDHLILSFSGRVTLKSYEGMTDENTGLSLIGTTNDSLTYKVSSSANTVARPWICIATGGYVYFFTYHDTTAMPINPAGIYSSINFLGVNFFFGNFEKLYQDDGFAVAFLCSTWAAGGRHGFGEIDYGVNTREAHFIARNLAGEVGNIACAATMAPPGATSAACFGSSGPIYDGQTPLLVSKVALNNGVAGSFRGFLPDMLAPCHPFPFNNLDTVEVNGETYVAVTWLTINTAMASNGAQGFFKIDG
jgi:hypothetical protein